MEENFLLTAVQQEAKAPLLIVVSSENRDYVGFMLKVTLHPSLPSMQQQVYLNCDHTGPILPGLYSTVEDLLLGRLIQYPMNYIYIFAQPILHIGLYPITIQCPLPRKLMSRKISKNAHIKYIGAVCQFQIFQGYPGYSGIFYSEARFSHTLVFIQKGKL